MVPDLDAIHTWNGFDINNLWVSTGVPRFPRVRIDPVSGLGGFHALPEGSSVRDQPVGRWYRELPRRSMRRGKALVYSGWLEARTEADLDTLEDNMTKAFASMDEGVMTITQFGTGTQYIYKATCEALTIDGNTPAHRNDMTLGHKRTFTLGMRMTDGRFYSGVEQTIVGSPGTRPTGGLTVPFTVPFSVGSSGSSGLPGISYDAGAGSDPVITIPGPVPTPTLYSVTQNRQLVFTKDVPGNSSLVVDFDKRLVTLDGLDVTDYVIDSELSDYWDAGVQGLAAGVNKITLEPSSAQNMSMKVRKSFLA